VATYAEGISQIRVKNRWNLAVSDEKFGEISWVRFLEIGCFFLSNLADFTENQILWRRLFYSLPISGTSSQIHNGPMESSLRQLDQTSPNSGWLLLLSIDNTNIPMIHFIFHVRADYITSCTFESEIFFLGILKVKC
jgi:hypothetical protein